MYIKTDDAKIFSNIGIEAIDIETIKKVRRMAHNKIGEEHAWERVSDVSLLERTNLYNKSLQSGEEGLTLAGILLLGKKDVIHTVLPHYKTVMIYNGPNGSFNNKNNSIEISDNLIISYNKMMDFVDKYLDDRFYLEGYQRIDLRNKIFHQICVNMLIHRDFNNTYPAKFIIEKDVVTTENACIPFEYGLKEPNNFIPEQKNPIISKFFREIGLSRANGLGIPIVHNGLEIYSGKKPQFIEGEIFKQILPINYD